MTPPAPSNVQISTPTGGTNISLVIDSSYSGKTYGKPSGGANRSRARSSTGVWISCLFVASDDLVGASVYKRSSLANDRTPFRLMAPPRPRLPPVGLCRRTRGLPRLCSAVLLDVHLDVLLFVQLGALPSVVQASSRAGFAGGSTQEALTFQRS